MNDKLRIEEARQAINKMIAYEEQKGTHTFSMCNCGRKRCRRKCVLCLKEDLLDLDKQWKKYVGEWSQTSEKENKNG